MNRFFGLLLVVAAGVAMMLFYGGSQTTFWLGVSDIRMLGSLFAVFLFGGYQQYHFPSPEYFDIRIDPDSGPTISSKSVSRIGLSARLGNRSALLAIGKHDHIQDSFLRMFSIGPGSPLFARRGPISVLKNITSNFSAQLVLNDVRAEIFSSSCDPGTRFRIPLEYIAYRDAFGISNIGVQLLFPPSEAMRSDQQLNGEHPPVVVVATHPPGVILQHTGLLVLPPLLHNEITQLFIDTGAERTYYGGPFHPCDRDPLIDRLPRIIITFLSSSSNHQLVLYPDDYVQFTPLSRSCRLIVSEYFLIGGPLEFNPLSIPDVNVHIARDHLEFCDSIFE